MSSNWMHKFYANHYYWLAFFIILYLLLIIPNVLSMRYAAFDYGMYTNAIYDYGRWQFNEAPTFAEVPGFKSNLLVMDHVDLFLFIIAPLGLIFGFHTLWITQLLFIIFGALGIRKYVLLISKQVWLGNAALVFFCLHFGVWSALAYDYHGNVIAACILPWLLVCIHLQRYLIFYALALGMLLCKENIAVWLFFIGIYLFFSSEQKAQRKHAFILSSLSLVYFVFLVLVLLPVLNSGNAQFMSFQFKHYGNSFSDLAIHCLKHPLDTTKDIFTNHTINSKYNGIKAEAWLLLLFSGAVFLLKSPKVILLFIPLVLQKFLHDREAVWSVYYQYNIEFAVILALTLFTIYKIEIKWQRIVILILPLLALVSAFRIMDKSIAWFPKSQIRIYQAVHYENMHALTDYKKELSIINDHDKVCAQNALQALLSYRDKAYLFPHRLSEAGYLILDTAQTTYPLEKLVYLEKFNAINNDTLNWKRINSHPTLFVFKNQLK